MGMATILTRDLHTTSPSLIFCLSITGVELFVSNHILCKAPTPYRNTHSYSSLVRRSWLVQVQLITSTVLPQMGSAQSSLPPHPYSHLAHVLACCVTLMHSLFKRLFWCWGFFFFFLTNYNHLHICQYT